ncbi:MAG: aminotransferase class III-fold pyridoxal phosphate-dependent enzyme [Thermoanaerobaculales bacterium]|jgi:glutamate-1-semialdehyde 2,1-aminomutase|nr:aminotransferase class III-fold pyridoxal phosphate-dependent enzyme [Thermoanaerobaculales bacterium]
MGQRFDELMSRAATLPVLRAGAVDSVVAKKAQGPRVYDLDNVGFIDFVGGGGSSVLGFANQFVLDAVKKVLDSGVPVGFHVPQEVDLADSLGQFLPWVETWWFCRNQDEAMSAALSWARRSSGKEVIIALSGGARLSPGSDAGGEARGVVREIASWNAGRIIAGIGEAADEVAAVVIEPLMTRLGLIPLEPATVAAVVGCCRELGLTVIFDERVSGFRLARGGAASSFGASPDLAVYGGALGGGFPIGAVGFAARFGSVEPANDQTLATPHSVSLAAADAVLSILKNDATYARLDERSAQLADGIRNLADRFNRSIAVNRAGSVFALYLGVDSVASGTVARRADAEAYRRLAAGLRDEGVLLPTVPGGTGFVSSAHGTKDIEETLGAFERALTKIQREDRP